jgi:hypothetical protein
MKRSQLVLFFFITLLLFPAVSHGQPWSGIISPSRAIDWSGAGIPGGIPSGSWTQCGSTISAYSGTGATITNAIAACRANQYVLLGPGTFNLSTGIDFGHKSFVALRGSGANSTFLVFSGNGSTPSCNTGNSQVIGICGPDSTYINAPPAHIYNWSAGYAQGTNQITLSSTASITTVSSGSPTFLMLNQDDDGYTGYPASGSSVDNGGYWVCANQISPGPLGCSDNGPDGAMNSPLNNRWQYEIAVATAINGNVVTISPPLKHPNWRSGQAPKAWLFQTMQSSGVENLSVDLGNMSGFGISIWGCYKCWVSGVRLMNFGQRGIAAFISTHLQLQNNYLFNGVGADPYGFILAGTADNLFVNNIIQHSRSGLVFDGTDSGTVLAYNFCINDITGSENMFPCLWDHSAGDDFHLFEGNIASGVGIDGIHGTHLNETTFRNFFTGWESCANGQCGGQPAKNFQTIAMSYRNANRYGNLVGNVLGTPGYHTLYLTEATSSSSNATTVYNLGGGNGATSPPILSDPLVHSTALLWANWDNVTNAARFCGNSSNTGWSTTCTSTSEVPTGAPAYPNSVPTVGDTGIGQRALPASLYYSTKPSWFGSLPWPPIGPDVTNGNVGQCGGALNVPGLFNGVPATSAAQCGGSPLNTAWGGHVNTNPAMNCYLNVMGGPPDGSGNALSFNASACYGGVSSSQGPNPPTNLIVVVNPN